MTDTLLRLLKEAADEGFADFAAWCAENWGMSEKDRQASEPQESPDFARGWNACAESIAQAWECYKEENR